MDAITEQSPRTSVQTYVLAVICLLVGIATGYLLRSPAPAPAVAEVHPAQQMPPAGMQAATAQVTPDQMKHMADKKAEEPLAELKSKPNDPALLAQLGNIYMAAGQFQSAQEYYQRSVTAKPDPAAMTQLASSYYYAGDADKAIAVLNRVLQANPKYGDALFNLGMMQWRAKSDPKAAIELWEKFLKTNPKHPKRAIVEQALARVKQHLTIPPGTKTDKPAL